MEDVVRLWKEGDSVWESYVPSEARRFTGTTLRAEAASIVKESRWFQRYAVGGATSQEVIYQAFEVLDKVAGR